MHATAFDEVLSRVRSGDSSAVAQVYCEYLPDIRLVIHRRLRERSLAWAVEPDEVFNAVALTILCEGRLGPVADGKHLRHLLEQAVKRKVVQVMRVLTRRCRDFRREDHNDQSALVDNSAENTCDEEELLAVAWESLRAHERLICMLHRADYTWDEIACRLAMTSAAVRKTFQRAELKIRRDFCCP